MSSGSRVQRSWRKETKSSNSDKENAHCSVCLCVKGETQRCIFCACHVDKKSHIPRCDCHEKSVPKFLLPGFCKCHRRNKQYFAGCKCDDIKLHSSNCPCCEYFYKQMRAKVYEAHMEKTPTASKPPEKAKPHKYFLKLEETEISKDSTDLSDADPEKKPVEVITIKIPVKRRGKLKVPSSRFYYAEESDRRNELSKQADVEYLDDIIRKYSRHLSDRKSHENLTVNEDSTGRKSKRTKDSSNSYRSLQDWLESNRPDFCSSAESRRQIIVERARDRELNQQCRVRKSVGNMCLLQPPIKPCPVPRRIFTTSQLKQQTMKRYKRLNEVTQKKEERKKKEEYRTNKIMADIYAKKLQLKTLRGEVNLSNSISLLSS